MFQTLHCLSQQNQLVSLETASALVHGTLAKTQHLAGLTLVWSNSESVACLLYRPPNSTVSKGLRDKLLRALEKAFHCRFLLKFWSEANKAGCFFIFKFSYLFENCPSSMHHCSAQHGGMQRAIVKPSNPLWSETGTDFPGRQIDRHVNRDLKIRNWTGNSIISLRLCFMCGPDSHGEWKDLSLSTGA